MISTFFRGMQPTHITQGFHKIHPGLDVVGAYGTPLCAPEDCLVQGINGDKPVDGSLDGLRYGYGISLKGKETGHTYLYWHCLPYFPVWGGDSVKRGQIVAFMGNAGHVVVGGQVVPIDERLSPSKPGTHLHIEMEMGELDVDPLPLINFNWQPQWGYLDLVRAISVCLVKMARAIK
jgi:murein DD-endopeptidase MepM/ murein hydrolase activator NlpD